MQNKKTYEKIGKITLREYTSKGGLKYLRGELDFKSLNAFYTCVLFFTGKKKNPKQPDISGWVINDQDQEDKKSKIALWHNEGSKQVYSGTALMEYLPYPKIYVNLFRNEDNNLSGNLVAQVAEKQNVNNVEAIQVEASTVPDNLDNIPF